ncbi:MAG: hypothetical protein R2736_08790 [Solirubrobacterales bacterium]
MGRLDDLSPDQRAVVQLLLQQGKRYDEPAALLRIEPAAVRARAQAALSELGRAAGATEPPEASARRAGRLAARPAGSRHRAGHRGAGGRRARPRLGGRHRAGAATGRRRPRPAAARPRRASSPPPAADASLPGFGPAPPGGGAPRASRLGGALLILGLAVVAAVVLILVLRGGDGDDTSTSASTAAQTTATTGTTEAQPTIEGQVNLRPPGGGDALGVATIFASNGQRGIVINAQGLKNRKAYVVWLTGGRSGAVKRLGLTPTVGRNGRLNNVTAVLPDDAKNYRRLELSLETDADPQRPTDVVLRGRF